MAFRAAEFTPANYMQNPQLIHPKSLLGLTSFILSISLSFDKAVTKNIVEAVREKSHTA
jgi:hypothetical protein